MIDPSRPRRLIIHAGTHKTASTYIQARLHLNRDLLLSQRITYRFPSSESTTFKSLTKAISDDAWSRWDDYLSSFDQSPNDVLISAEQFSSRLCDPKVIARLRRVASTHGYELSIVIFIRSQLDYINSRYAYSLKRFYHTQTFETYITEVLDGHLPGRPPSSGSSNRAQTKRQDVFDFWNYFSALLEARRDGLTVTFIPFRQTDRDPFVQLLQSLELDPGLPWAMSSDDSRNRSPGTRGTWLARALGLRLAEHGISQRVIRNSSAIIPSEEKFRGWKDPSFWGYDRELGRRVTRHFKSKNNHFAEAVWGQSWKAVFVHDDKLRKRPQSTFSPSSPLEAVRMNHIADHLLLRVARRLEKRPLHLLREPLERISSILI